MEQLVAMTKSCSSIETTRVTEEDQSLNNLQELLREYYRTPNHMLSPQVVAWRVDRTQVNRRRSRPYETGSCCPIQRPHLGKSDLENDRVSFSYPVKEVLE